MPSHTQATTLTLRWRAMAALWSLLTLWSLCSACDSSDCVIDGCEVGQVCDRESGLCAEQPLNCTDLDCPEGQVCDTQTGRCIDRGTFCQPPGEDTCPEGNCQTCPDGLVCDALSGFCVAQGECRYIDCPRAQECNPDTRACEDVQCDADDACPAGSVCQMGICQAGCRTDAQCRDGEICELVGQVGSCRTSCTSDEECDWGLLCVLQGSGRSSCEPEPPCERDDQCRLGETCRSNLCQRALCARDGDCSEGEYCVTDTGQCLADTCQSDRFEPNDAPIQAEPLLLGGYEGLTLCKGEDDWFTIQTDGAPMRISVLHSPDVDLDLEAYANMELIARAGHGRTSETMFVPATAVPGELFIRVQNVRGQDVSYYLNIVQSNLSCEDDNAEPNNSIAQATTIAMGQTQSFMACPGDIDIVTLQATQSPATIEMVVAGDDQTRQARLSLGPNPVIDLKTNPDGLYTLELAHMNANPFVDMLALEPVQWSISARPEGPICQDTAQNHGPAEATIIELNPDEPWQSRPNPLCAAPAEDSTLSFEEDWLNVLLPDGPFEINVTLTHQGQPEPWGAGPMRITLLSGPEQTPVPWRSATAAPAASAQMRAQLSALERPLWLRVDAPEGLPDVLAQWPQYQIQLSATALTDQCIQDRSEAGGNDTPETATALPPEGLEAILCAQETDFIVLALTEDDLNAAPPLELEITQSPALFTIHTSLQDPTPLYERTLGPDDGVVTLQDVVTLPPETEFILFSITGAESDTGYRLRASSLGRP